MARFLFSVHLYPPKHNCGGESFIHSLAKFLISKGHECRVLLHQANQHNITQSYEWEGVSVWPPSKGMVDSLIHWLQRDPGGVFTHLEYTAFTISLCRVFKLPCFFIVHNTHMYDCAASPDNRVNIIYNSNYAKDTLQYPHPSIVLHPPVDYRKFNVCENPIDNPYITIINFNENKGGYIFHEIARRMSDRKFFAVTGSYEDQIDMSDLPNVTVLPNSPDILSVYKQTRILLMPSEMETWGMCATEAMSSGIPVIASALSSDPKPVTNNIGLHENCGDAGIYVNRLDIEGWVREIIRLDGDKSYKLASDKCRKRAMELDPLNEYAATEQFILNRDNLHVASEHRRY